MHVQVQIQLTHDEYASELAGNASELAVAVLKAIGGDDTKDVVNVSINDSGTAGTMPGMAPPPPPEPKPK